ncbi:MAG: ATP-dependent zinc metalloprotease FtsH, partial [Candidatus Latescibacterota bacterium]
MNQNKKPYRASDEQGKNPDANNRPDRRDLLKKRRLTPRLSNGRPGGKPGWSFGHRIAFVVLLLLLGVFLWKQMNSPTANYSTVSYTRFDQLLNTQQLDRIIISEGSLRARLKTKMKVNPEDTRISDGIITQIGAYDQAFVKDLAAKGIDVKIEPEKTWMNILVGTLPWVLVFGVWLFFLRQMQGGPKGVFSFGKSKAKLIAENSQKITFADVAGVPEAKEELQEIIEFLKDPRKFQRLGGKIPKGALLFGPPGTGKTLLARAVAGEAGVPFFSMSGSDFVEMFVGVGASRVRDLFEQGKSNAPCIIFIDEIDAVGRQRGAGIGGGHDEREQTLNQLLVEMDGFESNEGVILIAATNRPDVLDPALLRPGRFDRQIVVDWPDVKARAEILKVHARKIQLDQSIDLDSIAKGTPGMTGADLANVVNEAALLAARLNRKRVTMADFEEAKDKVMMGAARKTLVITEDEKRLTAYHEAGHVLVSKHVPGSDPVHKVSIVARGRALGLTHFLPQDERHNWSFKYCMDKMAVLLGGRAAEMVRFGDITNGAANDIERATDLARKMVCEWGMSKRLGPLTFGKKDTEIFLGRDIATHKDYSEQTAVAI